MRNRLYALEFEKPLRDLDRQLEQLHQLSIENNVDVTSEVSAIERKIEATKRAIYTNLTPWQRVQIARHPKRPFTLDFVEQLFTDFQEFHGDRMYRDDPSMVGGPAKFEGRPVMLIGQQKGRDTKENLMRNFGMPHPEGYRKAMRLMNMAEKFELPIVSFVDTPGAYPGVGSEERHVAEAIAVNQRDMSRLKVPIITVVIGEGGSGGALGIAVADRVLLFENAYYSVISPESCSAILWKDKAFAPKAAAALCLGDSEMLKKNGVIDEIVLEPFGGNHNDPDEAARNLAKALRKHLKALSNLKTGTLIKRRYDRFRNLGVFEEGVMS
ncbi:MAG: acetyl-CoA carboxylase carboxyl transferase subunit alpha [Verrucomicrobia bacterium]|nr:MAG: acetyl-CoA carboxylase carboxyl transferase subunit alpha [Verrucomicrobiota bacterium]